MLCLPATRVSRHCIVVLGGRGAQRQGANDRDLPYPVVRNPFVQRRAVAYNPLDERSPRSYHWRTGENRARTDRRALPQFLRLVRLPLLARHHDDLDDPQPAI